MIRTLVRACALAAGAAVALSALATPAAAEEIVPSGCAGSIAYVCTGDATPYPYLPTVSRTIPVVLRADGAQVVPGMTLGGQEVGHVVIPVGGVAAPGLFTTVGPTDPMPTGVMTPVQICAFATCIAAGTPVVIPGLPLPVVPVSVPPTTLLEPGTVTVPLEITIPQETTPPVATSDIDQRIVTVRIMLYPHETYTAGDNLCRSGGGDVRGRYDATADAYVWRCDGGRTAAPASAVLLAYSLAVNTHAF